jgi:AcrR family transcriptional regulator
MVVGVSTGRRNASRVLSPADWIDAAMDALIEGGVAAVAVEPLAARLGATKGSFYHHFTNRDGLIIAALEEWEQSMTEAIFERLEVIPDPAERLRAIFAAAFADRAGLVRDAALIAASTHPLVQPIVRRVTDRRLKYVADMYVRLGMPPARARRRAVMLYQACIGFFDRIRLGLTDPSDAEVRAYAQEVLDTLIPAGPRKRPARGS